jgi:CheY-like chemotaxis protein
MQKIIVTNEPETYCTGFPDVQIVDVASINASVPETWAQYDYEYLPFFICSKLPIDQVIVAIDIAITSIDKYLLAHHILSTLNKPVVLFVSNEHPENLQTEHDYGLFRSKAIQIRTLENVRAIFSDPEKLARYSGVYETEFDFDNYADIYQRLLPFNKHQATNEWGAIKLLLCHGMTLAEIESSSYQIPKTVYFKQKLAIQNIKEDTKIDFSSYGKLPDLQIEKGRFPGNVQKISKILLIDDNADKGWRFALEKIFAPVQVEVCTCFEDADGIADYSIYDLIFLDLRLPEKVNGIHPDIENGKKLIRSIKANKNALYIPLIVFTASQQARTMHEVLNLGADAMYVKEPPDWSVYQSMENYHDLIRLLNRQILKGVELKSYWKAIEQIKRSFLPEIIDTALFKFKSRIEERLEMFYGLLKKKHEEFEYNMHRFHFSGEVLAFITLWSILNEIQEAYFEKRADDWKIKNQHPGKFYLKIRMIGGQKKLHSDFQLTPSKALPYYEFDPGGMVYREYNYRKLLSLQIAFLLKAKNQLRSPMNMDGFLQILHDANEQRNALYLTHGDDLASGYYDRIEKAKLVSAPMTQNLFKLVTYLLTGNDTIF